MKRLSVGHCLLVKHQSRRFLANCQPVRVDFVPFLQENAVRLEQLTGGNFLQVLKSLSPISWVEPLTPVVPPPAGGVPVGGVAAAPGTGGVGRPRFPAAPGKPGNGGRGAPGGVAGAGGDAVEVEPGGAESPGLTRTGLPSGPVTTAARTGLAPRSIATTTETRCLVCLVIGCCSPW